MLSIRAEYCVQLDHPMQWVVFYKDMKRASRALVFLAMAVLAAIPQRVLVAQVSPAVTGQWTLLLGKRTLFVLTLEPSSGQSDPMMGSLSRPAHFATADAMSFSDVKGPTEVDKIVASQWEGHVLSFTTQNPNDPNDKTVYKLTLKDRNDVQLKIEGIPLPPLTLVRSQGSASVSDDWHSGQRYFPDDDASSNPEMKRIFDEDQRARQALPNIDWPTVTRLMLFDAQQRCGYSVRALFTRVRTSSGLPTFFSTAPNPTTSFLLTHLQSLLFGKGIATGPGSQQLRWTGISSR